MKKSFLLTALSITLLATTSFAASTAKGALSLPVGGNFTDAAGGQEHFNGTFLLREFAVENNARVNATCDILNLVLGPLHLDLLGLTVDLNQVVLDIAAQSGQATCLATCSAR